MNSLSWLIYFIGVVDSLNWFAWWLAIPGTIGLFVVIVSWIFMNACDVENISDASHKQKAAEAAWKWWNTGKNIAFAVWFAGWFMMIVIPSRQTLILIAGSEIGQQVAQSKAVQDVVNPSMDLLKTWIFVETSRLKKEITQEKK